MRKTVFVMLMVMMGVLSSDKSKADETKPAGEVFRLWAGDAPGALGQAQKDIPTLTLFLADPKIATGAAMIVCPGGSYETLAPYEGEPPARWLNSIGITAAVLKYRLGSNGYHHPIEMQDAQRAIRFMRSKAEAWKIDPKRVGILGFSAGGHLASTVATHFDDAKGDDIDRQSGRPDLALLLYPVITMKSDFTHRGSRKALLGEKPDPKLIDLLSNETQVTADTPPCFLLHGEDDSIVPVQDSIEFANACKAAKVPMELHLFEHGRHGFGMAEKETNGPEIWPKLAEAFLRRHGF